MKPAKIALCGKARAGKDTVAVHLAGTYGFHTYAFGDALKDVAKRLYRDKFDADRKPRALLQTLGEHLCEYDPDIFIDATFTKIADDIRWLGAENVSRIAITDLRKQHELNRLRAEGFTVIRVTAPDELRLARAKQAGDDFSARDFEHPTEMAVDGFAVDYEVTNDGSLDDLWTQVDEIMRTLGVEPRRERRRFL